jgi:hypothetical protein
MAEEFDETKKKRKKKKSGFSETASETSARQKSGTNKESSNPEAPEAPEDSRLGIELGIDNNLPFSQPYRPRENGTRKSEAEELMEIFRDESAQQGPSTKQLITMRRMDGQAQALYRLLTLPIRSALTSSTFVPADGGEEEAEFIDLVFNTSPAQGGMSVTFHKFMSQMLQALFDGYVAFEKVFWKPEFGPLEGKYTLKKLAHRPADTLTFVADKTGGFAGLRQRAYNGKEARDIFIEPEYCFYFASQEEQRKFYGVSFFQAAFYHYDMKVKLYYTAHLAAQRAAVGTRVGTHPANSSRAAKRAFAESLGNLSLAQYMMMPEGYKVELLKDSGSYDFLSLINHHNSQMSKSLLAGFFDEDQGKGASDSTLVNFAQPGDDMFILMLRTIMDDIANQINHYVIPQLIDYNFTGGKYPTFTWGKLTDEQRAAIGSMFEKFASAGQSSLATPEFVRALEENVSEQLGLEIDYDEVDKRIEEEQAAVEEQLAAQAQQEQGVGPDGQPLDQTDPVDEFEKTAVGLTTTEEEAEAAYRDLMRLAGEFLDESGT